MTVGDRIKQLRDEKGWSQLELARGIGADGRQISRYENGHIQPSLDMVVRLARSFNVSVDYLLFDKAPRRPKYLDENHFSERWESAHDLPYEDKAWLLEALEALLAKKEIRNLARRLD